MKRSPVVDACHRSLSTLSLSVSSKRKSDYTIWGVFSVLWKLLSAAWRQNRFVLHSWEWTRTSCAKLPTLTLTSLNDQNMDKIWTKHFWYWLCDYEFVVYSSRIWKLLRRPQWHQRSPWKCILIPSVNNDNRALSLLASQHHHVISVVKMAPIRVLVCHWRCIHLGNIWNALWSSQFGQNQPVEHGDGMYIES